MPFKNVTRLSNDNISNLLELNLRYFFEDAFMRIGNIIPLRTTTLTPDTSDNVTNLMVWNSNVQSWAPRRIDNNNIIITPATVTVNGVTDPDPNYARVQSTSFNVALQRNDINALGYKLPVHKSVQMPIQVTTEIVVVSTTDDGIQVSAFTSACQNTSALRPSTIRLALCNGDVDNIERADANGVRIYAGNQNKLTSVAFGQGGTGGGNVQTTYSYQSNNNFTVVAAADPNQHQLDSTGNILEPVYNTDPDDPHYGEITQPGGWWENRVAWVC
jgi:hypothetical protein